jgi:hypothetical protein
MHYKIYEDVFDQTRIDTIVEFYNNRFADTHLTNGMYKIEDPWNLSIVQENIKPVLSNYFNTNLENIGDNIYKHNDPYFPHCDTSIDYPCFNVLIPLKVFNDLEQKFCIFDQYINDFSSGATWMGKWYAAASEFEHNKKRRFPFKDSIVENKTDVDIDEEMFTRCLEARGRDRLLFKNLSGIAVDFTPGSLIIFDSKHIHCTGRMDCDWKMGLSLRFKGEFDKEVK